MICFARFLKPLFIVEHSPRFKVVVRSVDINSINSNCIVALHRLQPLDGILKLYIYSFLTTKYVIANERVSENEVCFYFHEEKQRYHKKLKASPMTLGSC